MAEFCSICEPNYFDINLPEMALDLEPGHSENILCEGCNVRALYKDESGILFLAKLVDNEIILEQLL